MRTNAAVSITLPRVATDAFLPYTSFVVILAMLFGGAGGYGWSDAVVELAALPLLAWALFKITPSQLGRGGQWAIGLLCAIIAWPLLQLIPMPPSLWSGLPGRGEIASAYEAAGMTLPWLPISLYPSATWLGLLSLLPATAIFLAMLSLEQRSRRILIVLMFIIIFASVVVGHATDNGRRGAARSGFTQSPIAIELLDFLPTQTTMPRFYIPQFHSLQRGRSAWCSIIAEIAPSACPCWCC